jgi:hypothetical protein
MTLEILGIDISGDSLWFNHNGHETDITPSELAILRMRIIREDRATVPWGDMWLDESEVTTLINALGEHDSGVSVLVLYPLVPCRYCDTASVVLIEGDGHCADHAQSYGLREDEGAA